MRRLFERSLGAKALCCVWLTVALAACSGGKDMGMDMAPDGSMDGPGEKPPRFTVFFEENCAGSQELHASITFSPPPYTLVLPEAPGCEGHVFVGWNTQSDGGGTAFNEETPVTGNLSVYAQWEALDRTPTPEPVRLQLYVLSDTLGLTTLKIGEHDESVAQFSVVVSTFEREEDANVLCLRLPELDGLSFETTSRFDEGTKTFTVTVAYDGEALFEEGFAEIPLRLKNLPDGYAFTELPSLHLPILDGKTQTRRIPVHAGNIYAFNAYANTEEGLTLHYKLTEDVELEAPEEPEGSNWVPIGYTRANAFSGSFDGGGYALKGLTIHAPDGSNQSLFGWIVSEDVVVENVGLEDLNVLGKFNVGGLVGTNSGTIRNSHVSGNITAQHTVGALVGTNAGTVQNSYATASVTGSSSVGGLVGLSSGTVQNSYAAVSVEGGAGVGGLVGGNGGIVQNSYAEGSIEGSNTVGGLVGANAGTVQNSYATATVEGSNAVGGLAGDNNGTGNSNGTVQNSYATGSIAGSSFVGGLVGGNSKRLENSVALNASIVFTSNYDSGIGRVQGDDTSADLENNHARDDMVLTYDYGNSNTPYVPTPAPDGNDGADVTAEEYATQAFWEELGFDFTEDWAWNNSTRLPVLRGVGGEQGHLVPTAVHYFPSATQLP